MLCNEINCSSLLSLKLKWKFNIDVSLVITLKEPVVAVNEEFRLPLILPEDVMLFIIISPLELILFDEVIWPINVCVSVDASPNIVFPVDVILLKVTSDVVVNPEIVALKSPELFKVKSIPVWPVVSVTDCRRPLPPPPPPSIVVVFKS